MENYDNQIEDGIPMPGFASKQPAWIRLENQLNWYDSKSLRSQRWYKTLKILQVTLAVIIPVTHLLPDEFSKWASSLAGIVIAILEAVQQMNQYSTTWITYRSTAEQLRHEKYLFLSCAGPYRDLPESERLILLAERVEKHISTEHANWINEAQRIAFTNKSDKK